MVELPFVIPLFTFIIITVTTVSKKITETLYLNTSMNCTQIRIMLYYTALLYSSSKSVFY